MRSHATIAAVLILASALACNKDKDTNKDNGEGNNPKTTNTNKDNGEGNHKTTNTNKDNGEGNQKTTKEEGKKEEANKPQPPGASGRRTSVVSVGPGKGGAGTKASPQVKPTEESSGLPRTKRLTDLTVGETTKLCDWTASRFGGYNVVTICGGGNEARSFDSRQDCVTYLRPASLGCKASVGDVEDCIKLTQQKVCSPTPVRECASTNNCVALAGG
jgi:hypothetical protein